MKKIIVLMAVLAVATGCSRNTIKASKLGISERPKISKPKVKDSLDLKVEERGGKVLAVCSEVDSSKTSLKVLVYTAVNDEGKNVAGVLAQLNSELSSKSHNGTEKETITMVTDKMMITDDLQEAMLIKDALDQSAVIVIEKVKGQEKMTAEQAEKARLENGSFIIDLGQSGLTMFRLTMESAETGLKTELTEESVKCELAN